MQIAHQAESIVPATLPPELISVLENERRDFARLIVVHPNDHAPSVAERLEKARPGAWVYVPRYTRERDVTKRGRQRRIKPPIWPGFLFVHGYQLNKYSRELGRSLDGLNSILKGDKHIAFFPKPISWRAMSEIIRAANQLDELDRYVGPVNTHEFKVGDVVKHTADAFAEIFPPSKIVRIDKKGFLYFEVPFLGRIMPIKAHPDHVSLT